MAQRDGGLEGLKDEGMDGRMDGWKDGWTEVWIDGQQLNTCWKK